MEVEAEAGAEAKAEALIRFSWKQLLLLLPCKYFEALSREIELIFLRLLEKDILELDFKGCFENHDY